MILCFPIPVGRDVLQNNSSQTVKIVFKTR
jgi:hypothetical protein